MNSIDDDKLIARFFNDNAVRIDDGGFSRRVMRRLPSRAARLNRIWTAVCAVALVIVAVKMNVAALLRGLADSLVPRFLSDSALLHRPLLLLVAVSITVSLAVSAAMIRELR